MASSDSSSALGFPAGGASSGASDPKSLEISSTEDEHAPLDDRGRVLFQAQTTRLPALLSQSPAGRRSPSQGGYGPLVQNSQKRNPPTLNRGNSTGSAGQSRVVHFGDGRPPLHPRGTHAPPDAADALEPDTKRHNSSTTSPSATPVTSWTAISPLESRSSVGVQGGGTSGLLATESSVGAGTAIVPHNAANAAANVAELITQAMSQPQGAPPVFIPPTRLF